MEMMGENFKNGLKNVQEKLAKEEQLLREQLDLATLPSYELNMDGSLAQKANHFDQLFKMQGDTTTNAAKRDAA